ncbi:MAG: hypothetical protein ACP5HU_08105 [Phycisphaerae bacterium]
MRPTRLLLVLLVAMGLCAGASAQSVVEQLPAGAMGYVVVNDVRALTDNVDTFLADIGLGEMVSQGMPEGLLAFLKEEIELGESFNADGAFAIVLMDFQQFGFDAMKLMPGGQMESPSDTPPFAVWVPGNSIEGLFADFETDVIEGRTVSMTPGPPLYALQQGGHVVLAMRQDVIDAIENGGGSAATVLNDSEKKVLADSHIAAYVNMRTAGPVLDKFLEVSQEQLAAGQAGPGMGGPPMDPEGMRKMLGWYRRILPQLEGMVFSGRFVDEGLVVDQLVRYVPDSMLGRIVNAYQPVQAGLLDRLPDMPYVLALGSRGTSSEPQLENEFIREYLEILVDVLPGDKLGDEGLAELQRIVTSMKEQVDSVQFVAGGGPEAGGIFSVGAVMQCKDADATGGMVREAIGYVEDFIKAVAPPGEAEDVEVRHTAAAETIGGTSVDIIEITDPEMQDMPDYEKEEMAAVLGEAKVQFRMARPDANTVVVTFGGADAFMSEVLTVAGGGGDIPEQPGTQAALKYMPADANFVALLNLKNLGTVIQKGAETLGAAEMLPPLNFTADVPIAMGAGVTEDTCIRQTAFVPTAVVGDLADMFMMFSAPRQQDQPVGPMEGGEDF